MSTSRKWGWALGVLAALAFGLTLLWVTAMNGLGCGRASAPTGSCPWPWPWSITLDDFLFLYAPGLAVTLIFAGSSFLAFRRSRR